MGRAKIHKNSPFIPLLQKKSLFLEISENQTSFFFHLA